MLDIKTQKLHKTIFLIGDDGQMSQLLQRIPEAGNAVIHSNVDILAGIGEVSAAQPDIILLNLCSCSTNCSAIVKALNIAAENAEIIGFGEAWTETFYSGTARKGMKDLIILPASIHEIKNLLFRNEINNNCHNRAVSKPLPAVAEEDLNALVNVFSSMAHSSFIEVCKELSQSIPYGPEILRQKAETAFSKFLNVKKIKIYNDLKDSAADMPEFTEIDFKDFPLISMTQESLGIMRIWPGNNRTDTQTVNSICGFLAALLELALRDHNLKSLATTDELTGAFNRRYFESYLRQLLESAEQDKLKIAILVFDIDNFKYFNDTHGHIAGDKILLQATELARKCCRKHDVVARLGGDEFAILFWDSPELARDISQTDKTSDQMPDHAQMVMRLSENFRKLMSQSTCASRYGNNVSKLTISGGVAAWPNDGTSVRKLLIAADNALLRSKYDGKDKINLSK